jgi:hypothetical protein
MEIQEALGAINRPSGTISGAISPHKQRLLVAGATGLLGAEALALLLASPRFTHVTVLAHRTHAAAPAGMRLLPMDDLPPEQWPAQAHAHADVAVVMFDPPKGTGAREAALFAAQPQHMMALGRWLQAQGVHSLAVVMPHAQASLPSALAAGLANFEEHGLAALGWQRLLIVRSAQAPSTQRAGSPAEALARWMLSITRFMVPQSEQPLRAVKVAAFAVAALEHMLEANLNGVRVASAEQVWQSVQSPDLTQFVQDWLQPDVKSVSTPL